MTRHAPSSFARSRAALLPACALGVLLALFLLPATAYAHAHVRSTSPASGARLTAAPTQLVLTFSEAPALAVSALRLVGPDSSHVTLGDLTHGGGANTLTARINGALRAGRYTVLWQTAGDDGHMQHGSFQFTIADGAAGLAPVASVADSTAAQAPAAPVAGSASRDAGSITPTSASMDVSSPVYVVIRWVQFAALLLVIGAVAFRWWVLPRAGVALGDASRLALSTGAATSGLRGAWLLALTGFARLAAQLATMRTASTLGSAPSFGGMVLGTPWGDGWLLEIIALAVSFAALRAARRDAARVLPWQAAAAAAAALAFVPALSGHAVADRTFAPFTLLFDGVHVLAAGAWLGTLAVLLGVGLGTVARAADTNARDVIARMVNAFSPLALTCAAVLVFTGVVAARVHVASWAAFTGTAYGRTLLVKLALVLLLVLVGAWNWRRVKPTLASTGPAPLARSARVELLVALAILLATAILVALPTPVDLAR